MVMKDFMLRGVLLKRTNRWCKVATKDSLERTRVVRVPRSQFEVYPQKSLTHTVVSFAISHDLAYSNKLLSHDEIEGG